MLFLYCLYVLNVPEVQLVDYVADIEGLDVFVNHQSGEDVLICMATYVEITRNLFYSK